MNKKTILIFIWLSLFNFLEAKTSYTYEVSACLVFQNEARFLKEWLEYHKLIGIEHFYLFNNLSTDHYLEVLDPYIKSGEVELFHDAQPSNNQSEYLTMQCRVYNKALQLAKNKSKWLALIDADEFLFPVQPISLPKLLKKYKNFGGLYVNWLLFGTSYIEKIPENRLMIEMLTQCSKKPVTLGKSIVRPERVSLCKDPHRFFYHPPYDHVNANFENFNWVAPVADQTLLLYHYYTGDLFNLIHIKYPRRIKWEPLAPPLSEYIADLDKLNEVENFSMQRFIPILKKKLFISNLN